MRYLSLPVSLLLVSCLSTACSSPTETANTSPDRQPVRVIVVAEQSQQSRISASGVVSNAEATRLSFKTGGIVAKITVDAGDRVRAGQLLASLNSTDVDAQLEQAKTAADKAVRDFERAQRLFAQGVIAEQAVQDAQSQQQATQAALQSARFNRNQSSIRAMADGIVLERLAEPNETVAPGAPILVVGREDLGWQLEVGVSDRVAPSLKVGDTAMVQLNSSPETAIAARIKDIGASVDKRTGTITVRLSLTKHSTLRYWSGQVGHADLPVHQGNASGLRVPLAAVLEINKDQGHVFVIEDNVAKRRKVAVANLQTDTIEVLSGLRAGEQLVVEGAAWLNADAPVHIVP